MAKRRYGSGAVFHRSDGRWESQFRLADGSRKCVYGKTRREVVRRLREVRWELANGFAVSSRKLHLRQYFEYWLEQNRGRVRHNTFYSLKLSSRRLLDEVGDIPVSQLSPAVIQGAYHRLHVRGLSTYSVLQAHRMLNRAMNQAVQWGLIPSNPVARVLPPRPRKREMTALQPDQLVRLLDGTIDEDLHPLYVVLGTAGLRMGEALGLSWDDVDLIAGRLVVHRALQNQVGVGLVFVPLKTASSYRTVVLTRRAVQALHLQRQRLQVLRETEARWMDQGLVFPNSVGGPMYPGRPNHDLKPLLRRLALPQIRAHDLRHTTASVLLTQGVHPKVVQEMLGHSTIATTMDTYSHVMPTMHDDAVRKLDEVLERLVA
jgi:integrase